MLSTGSGSVDFPEFLNMMANKMDETNPEEQVKEAFRVFDTQGEGHITTDELRSIFTRLHVVLYIGHRVYEMLRIH